MFESIFNGSHWSSFAANGNHWPPLDSTGIRAIMLAPVNIQFTISGDDEVDFKDLQGEDTMAAVARKLFMYGLDNSAKAFAAYAAPHEAKRRNRREHPVDNSEG